MESPTLLILENGKLRKWILPVNCKSLFIGSGNECDVKLASKNVTSRHCRLFCEKDAWFVESFDKGVVYSPNEENVCISPGVPFPIRNGKEIKIDRALVKLDYLIVNSHSSETELPVMDQSLAIAKSVDVNGRFLKSSPNPMHIENTLLPGLKTKERVLNSPISDKQQLTHPTRTDHDSRSDNCNAPITCLGGFKVEGCVGRGSFGDVYRVRRLSTNAGKHRLPLSIKLLRPLEKSSCASNGSFLRDVQIMTHVRNPFLVQSISCGEDAGQMYFVMEHINGKSLQEFLVKRGPMSVRRTCRLFDRILDAVDHCHRLGMVHRDLKPSRILLQRMLDGKYIPRVNGWGIANNYLASEGESGMARIREEGQSWPYVPMEQVTNFHWVNRASDIWSLGAIFYECLTGRQPRELLAEVASMQNVLQAKIKPVNEVASSVPRTISSFLMKALSVSPTERYANAGEMRMALQIASRSAGIQL